MASLDEGVSNLPVEEEEEEEQREGLLPRGKPASSQPIALKNSLTFWSNVLHHDAELVIPYKIPLGRDLRAVITSAVLSHLLYSRSQCPM